VFHIFTAVYRDIEQVYRLNVIDISLSSFNFFCFKNWSRCHFNVVPEIMKHLSFVFAESQRNSAWDVYENSQCIWSKWAVGNRV